jgi:hypothetical protein
MAHRHYSIHQADEMLEACQEGEVEQVGAVTHRAAAGLPTSPWLSARHG